MSSESSDANLPPPAPPGPPSAEGTAPKGGRQSAVQPDVKLERRVPPLFALFFYVFLTLAAVVWVPHTKQRSLEPLLRPQNLFAEIGLGVGVAIVLLGSTPWLVSKFRAVRELEREFGWILGEQRAWECVYLAILSGIAEEVFFRGAVHAALGPWLGLVVFATLHWPINGQFRAWPFTALVAGAILTAERMVTGTLIAPVITHILVNGVNLLRISGKYRTWKE